MKIPARLLIIFYIIFFNINVSFAIQDTQIKEDSVLTISDCVSIAISNSPLIKKTEYNLKVAESDVGLAKSLFFPTIGAQVGIYQEYNSNKNYENSSNYRELPTVSVYLRQLIWDFGKTSSLIKMQKYYKLAAEHEFMDSICKTIYNVKIMYFGVLKAQAIVEICEDNLLLCQKNLQRCKSQYKLGKKSDIDCMYAQHQLENAEIMLAEAKNNYKIAMTDLGNTMYIAYSPKFTIEKLDTFNFNNNLYTPIFLGKTILIKSKSNIKNVAFNTSIEKNDEVVIKHIPFSLDEAYDIANKNNLDLWVLESVVNAMQSALTYIKRQYYPELSGGVKYNFLNEKELSNNQLGMYVDLSTSVNLKSLKHDIDKGQAKLNLAKNDVYSFKQDLYFKIKKIYNTVNKNANLLPIGLSEIKLSTKCYNYENARYNTSKIDYIIYQQSKSDYINARLEYVNQLYEYNKSIADLEIAMHYHFDDLHARAEHALRYHYKNLIDKLEESMHCNRAEETKNK